MGPLELVGAEETAAVRFPSVIGYSARSGLGFSPSAEAYWNFGLVGAFLVPALCGLVLVYAYRRSSPWPRSPLELFYPILLARIPLTVRADSLQQVKALAAILLTVTIVWALDRSIRRSAPVGAE
ncbi:MAG: O-antigen polysaccharide polymerase Wzy [Nostocoides sp.]